MGQEERTYRSNFPLRYHCAAQDTPLPARRTPVVKVMCSDGKPLAMPVAAVMMIVMLLALTLLCVHVCCAVCAVMVMGS